MAQIEILPDERTLATQAATRFARQAGRAIQERGRFTVALAGGSTPQRTYTLLAKTPFTGQVEWARVHIFWGDERCVPPDHSSSNYHMANEALLSRVPVPGDNVYRIPGELSARIAAQIYEDELRRAFGEGTPRFDLVLLGLGEDGHTASLFPGSPLLAGEPGPVAAVDPVAPADADAAGRADAAGSTGATNRHPPARRPRVTLTPVVINAARRVIFLVAGKEKAEIVAEVLQGPYQPDRYPAQAIQPEDGELIWLLDDAAASKITRYS